MQGQKQHSSSSLHRLHGDEDETKSSSSDRRKLTDHVDDDTEEYDDCSVPKVVYVVDDIRENTMLCRWDTGCTDGVTSTSHSSGMDIHGSAGGSSREFGCDMYSNKATNKEALREDCMNWLGKNPAEMTPPRPPKRSVSPKLTKTLNKAIASSRDSGVDLDKVDLLPVNFTKQGNVAMAKTIATKEMLRLSNVLGGGAAGGLFSSSNEHEQQGPCDHPQVTVVFCIRRAGCGSCRDHGLQLSKLVSKMEAELNRHNNNPGTSSTKINLVGIIKETGVDDDALYDFYTKYFQFPIYKDEKRDMYKFLGNRKISTWQLLMLQGKLNKRYAQKQIENIPFGGDIFTQGGILIFDAYKRLQYVYYERYGDELDTNAIGYAIQESLMIPTTTTTRVHRTSTRTSASSTGSMPTSTAGAAAAAAIVDLSPRAPQRRPPIQKNANNNESVSNCGCRSPVDNNNNNKVTMMKYGENHAFNSSSSSLKFDNSPRLPTRRYNKSKDIDDDNNDGSLELPSGPPIVST